MTEDNLAALGDTLFITRLPATYSECGRVIAEAVARNQVGGGRCVGPDTTDEAPSGDLL